MQPTRVILRGCPNFEPGMEPPRVLTKPSEPANNGGSDNDQGNLIIWTDDILYEDK